MKDIKVGDHVKHKNMDWTDFIVQHIQKSTCIIYSKQMSNVNLGHCGTDSSFSYKGNGDESGHYFADKSLLTLKEPDKMEHEFKIGDIVKPKSGHEHSSYTFQILELDSTSTNFFYRCYSKELKDAGKGHDGGYDLNGERKGHWHFISNDLYLISDTMVQSSFNVGDVVLYTGEEFTIVGDRKDKGVVVFSRRRVDKKLGHNGTCSEYRGNGCEYGHYFVDQKTLKLIKSNSTHEIHRQDPEGEPRGFQSKIHSGHIKIASGCRPAGSGTTACRIGIKVGTGIVSHNRLQPHPSC